jgi:hypothetical protein
MAPGKERNRQKKHHFIRSAFPCRDSAMINRLPVAFPVLVQTKAFLTPVIKML